MPTLCRPVRLHVRPGRKSSVATAEGESGIINAPKRLNDEMAEMLRFKTATFAAFGLQRNDTVSCVVTDPVR